MTSRRAMVRRRCWAVSGPLRILAPVAVLLATTVAAFTALAGLAPAAGAVATSVWWEGTGGRPFTILDLDHGVTVAGESDQSVRLGPIVSWALDASSPIYRGMDPLAVDPRCIRPLGGGKLLLVNRRLGVGDASAFIAVVDEDGNEEWSYRVSDDPQLGKPFCADRFVRDGRELTLIADRDAARVFAVDEEKRIVWQYGVVGDPGLGVDRLSDPYWASYTPDDTVLIADNLGGHRVIEVRWADYRAGAPQHGFTADSIVWQYGTPGVPGSAPGQLLKPRSPQRLPGEARHTLITDADAHAVYEVDRAGRIVWRFGVVGHAGRPSAGRLQDPTYAERLSDGTTLIADTGNGLVVRVNASGEVVTSYDLAAIDPPEGTSATDAPEPRMVTPAPDGTLLVADSGYARFVAVGLPAQASLTSRPLDMGRGDEKKRFLSLGWTGEAPVGTGVVLSYRVDDGAWTALAGSAGTALPASAVGKRLQYRVTLVADRRTTSPRVDAVQIGWRRVVTGRAGGGGGGSPATPATGPGVAYMGGAAGSSTATVATGGGQGSGGGSGGGFGSGSGGSGGAGGSLVGTTAEEAADGSSSVITGVPVRVASGGEGAGQGSGGGGGVVDETPTTSPWLVFAVAAVAVALVWLVAARGPRRRPDLPREVPATVTKDVRLLKGVR